MLGSTTESEYEYEYETDGVKTISSHSSSPTSSTTAFQGPIVNGASLTRLLTSGAALESLASVPRIAGKSITVVLAPSVVLIPGVGLPPIPLNMPGPGIVIPFNSAEHSHLTPYLAAIQASCITHDRVIATFLPPLSHEKLLSWWKERIAETNDGRRLILLLVSDLEAGGRVKGPELMGVVMLWMPYSETGPFRASVEKLLIHKDFRGKGGARALMDVLEAEAATRGRTLLMLDTESGSVAEQVYKKLGFTELGKIPAFGISPTGELKDGTFFYKDLRQ